MNDTFRWAPVLTLPREQVRAGFERPPPVVTREQWERWQAWRERAVQSIRNAADLDSLAASARTVVSHG